MKPKITIHANQRWAERFQRFNLDNELAAAVPFGAQREGGVCLLSPCGAAFMVTSDGVVTTILERNQAIANNRALAHCDFSRPVGSVAPLTRESRIRQLEDIAAEHAAQGTPPLSPMGRKARFADLRQRGFDMNLDLAIYKKSYDTRWGWRVKETAVFRPLGAVK